MRLNPLDYFAPSEIMATTMRALKTKACERCSRDFGERLHTKFIRVELTFSRNLLRILCQECAALIDGDESR